MAATAAETIASWADLTRFDNHIEHGTPLVPAFIFRGQARADWSLQPRLMRALEGKGFSPAESIVVEDLIRSDFIAEAHLHAPPAALSDRRDIVVWWSLMQHYGAPTRLLDWTRSLYIAAYFAVRTHSDTPGAIWILHARTVERVMEKRYGALTTTLDGQEAFRDAAAPPALYFPDPLFKTDRMAAQQTAFTMSPQIQSDHAAIIDSVVPIAESEPKFLKVLVEPKAKMDIMRRLRHVRITARALFPGADGLGRAAEELVSVTHKMPTS